METYSPFQKSSVLMCGDIFDQKLPSPSAPSERSSYVKDGYKSPWLRAYMINERECYKCYLTLRGSNAVFQNHTKNPIPVGLHAQS